MVHPLDSRPSAFWKLNNSANTLRIRKRKKNLPIETIVAVVAALFLVGFGVIIGSQYQKTQTRVPVSGIVAGGTLRVPMTVQRGDTLWSLARRYGNPNHYILDRVDTLARVNKMRATATLMPGQRIVIPVSNPVEISRLQRNLAKNQ